MRGLTAAGACVLAACSGKETAVPSIAMDAGPTPTAAAEWTCLDHPVVPVARDPQPVTYVLPVVDFNSKPSAPTPVPGLDVTICDRVDCAPPAASPSVGRAPGQPEYIYAITFPFGFENATLRLSAPGYVPIDYYLGGPMIGAPDGGYVVTGLAIPMLRQSAFDELYASLGRVLPADPTTGTIALRTLNCLGERAAGVRIKVAPDDLTLRSTPFSLSSANIVTGFLDVTTDRGVMGLTNVLPGALTAHGLAPAGNETGQPYGATTVMARPGVISIVEIRDGVDRWGQ